MLRNLFAAAALVAAPVPASAPDAPPSPIPLVVCISSDGVYSGTAFRIGPKLLVSVAHVTSLRGCYIDGRKIRVIYSNAKQDFSLIADDRAGQFLSVDCGGYIKGRHYIALGHPRGIDQIIPVQLTATGNTDDDGEAILAGIFTAQPGHSGGPILDAETMKVVGTVNTADWENGMTGSVSLSATQVCFKSQIIPGKISHNRQGRKGQQQQPVKSSSLFKSR